MVERSLETRFRVLGASFGDAERGQVWRERLGSSFEPALATMVAAFGRDLASTPRELDRERLRELMTTVLPARLGGKEPFAGDLPDLVEDFLIFLAEEEGVASQWEWTSAIQESRAAYDQALANPYRPLYAAKPVEPDRRPAAKIGRNDPCPCGSGRKYKKCCLVL